MGMHSIVRHTLRCGAVLLIEPMAGVNSAALSMSIPMGYATDPEDRMGLASVASELLLRGAGELDSRGQADAFDRLGCGRSVDVGAQTMRIALSLLGQRLDEALPLLADMLRRPRFDGAHLEPCKELALQALASLADDPHERAALGARARHHPAPLNRTGYGDEAGLRALTIDDVRSRWSERARPVGSIIGVAGAVEPGAVIDRFERLLEDWSGEAREVEPQGSPGRGYAHETDQSNQVQIVLAQEAPREADDSAFRERVLTGVLSGGMSSRLFSEVREKRGLCYSVSASYRAERDYGVRSAYVGTTPERAQQSLDVLAGELARVGREGGRVERDEFERAVVGLKSRLVFAGESTGARAGALVADERKLGRPRTLEELTASVDAVTLDGVNEHAERWARGRATIQTLGPSALTPPEGL